MSCKVGKDERLDAKELKERYSIDDILNIISFLYYDSGVKIREKINESNTNDKIELICMLLEEGYNLEEINELYDSKEFKEYLSAL